MQQFGRLEPEVGQELRMQLGSCIRGFQKTFPILRFKVLGVGVQSIRRSTCRRLVWSIRVLGYSGI